MTSTMIALILTPFWLYILYALSKAKLNFWKFIIGSMGLFTLAIVIIQPVLTMPLARVVSSMAGIIGSLTGKYTAYFKYGIIFIPTAEGSMTLKVDFECSGIIEIMAFLSLIIFFKVYKPHEKFIVSVIGTAYIMICNAFRIALICLSISIWGIDVYFVMHTFVGRIIFYLLSILLYFYVFTKPQIVQIKVGNFKYDSH